MKPSDVRRKILEDHHRIRRLLRPTEDLARSVSLGESDLADSLRRLGALLLERLAAHLEWEDRHLGAALSEADAWGPERAERLAREHSEQRELLAHAAQRIEDERLPPRLLGSIMLDLVSLLHADMQEEEHACLDPSVLRDDVVGISVEAG